MKAFRFAVCFILLCFYCLSVLSQVSFRTIVPQHSIMAGESFQVQYVIENANEISNFSPPQFPGFRLVSGPIIYAGNKSTSYKNLVFTLAAIKDGRFKIYGATCLINGRLFKSNDVYLRVASPKESDESSYFLRSGEDPWKKIRENLFLKLIVDRQSCFIGEPLVATFKLYSRLQSKSDVIKNPGFYGFGVYDIIDVDDKVQFEENLRGHWFDVHTIRKVQLYPLQAGIFTIDAMELANKIEFSRSIVYKKTEQEISENMYNQAPVDDHGANTEVYEMDLKTDPINIKVKPLPGRNSADTFSGAVGKFSIKASVEKDSILRNGQNTLVIDINGAGNFQKISAPVVNWPQNIEAFEPSVTDTLDKRRVPLAGRRRFKYVFLSNKPGQYVIPPVSFSFFDLKTKTYKNVSTKPQLIFISAKNKTENTLVVVQNSISSSNKTGLLVGVVCLLALIGGIFLWMIDKKTRPKRTNRQEAARTKELSQDISIEDLCKPAELALENNDETFFRNLNQAIWSYFNRRFQFSGSQMNKTELARNLTFKGISPEKVDELIKLIHQSEIGIYTDANLDLNKKELFANTREILQQIETALS